MREIRFRAWDKQRKAMVFVEGLFNRLPYGFEDLSEWMQYTGLTDKNGKEIYEGDIVKVFYSTVDGESHSSICVVDSLLNYNFMCGLDHSDEIIIIGNIYENPELLEEEK